MLADLSPELNALLPAAAVTLTALLVLALGLLPRTDTPALPSALGLVGLGAGGVLVLRAWAQPDVLAFTVGSGDAALLRLDGLALYVSGVLLAAAAITLLMSVDYLPRRAIPATEYVTLVLLATAGMILMVQANDLVVLFLALELFSIALYVLCAVVRGARVGYEAALKYFVLGAFAAGFLFYGVALLYAGTGTTNLDQLAAALPGLVGHMPAMVPVGVGLLLVGLGFKVAIVPFHQWVPDVYEGAPTPVTAFMAAATKAAAFVVLLRVLWAGLPAVAALWQPLLAVLAVITMVVGNLVALVQSDMKRMLAYSAVAHAGYLLVAVVVGPPDGTTAALYYLLAYGLMNLGAFAVLVAIGPIGPEGRDATALDDLSGLASRHPGLSVAMAVFLFSLTGLPPTAGFLAKWYVFQAAIGVGQTVLAVAVVLSSVVSAFYYLRPVVLMYMAEPRDERPIEVPAPTAVAVATTALIVGLAVVLTAPLVSGAATASAGGPGAGAEAAEGGTPLYFAAPEFEKEAPPPGP